MGDDAVGVGSSAGVAAELGVEAGIHIVVLIVAVVVAGPGAVKPRTKGLLGMEMAERATHAAATAPPTPIMSFMIDLPKSLSLYHCPLVGVG